MADFSITAELVEPLVVLRVLVLLVDVVLMWGLFRQRSIIFSVRFKNSA